MELSKEGNKYPISTGGNSDGQAYCPDGWPEKEPEVENGIKFYSSVWYAGSYVNGSGGATISTDEFDELFERDLINNKRTDEIIIIDGIDEYSEEKLAKFMENHPGKKIVLGPECVKGQKIDSIDLREFYDYAEGAFSDCIIDEVNINPIFNEWGPNNTTIQNPFSGCNINNINIESSLESISRYFGSDASEESKEYWAKSIKDGIIYVTLNHGYKDNNVGSFNFPYDAHIIASAIGKSLTDTEITAVLQETAREATTPELAPETKRPGDENSNPGGDNR